MIGLDTNVLLRWLISPQEWNIGATKEETELVSKVILSNKFEFFVNPIVIAETIWIVEQKLKLNRREVCEIVDRLLYSVDVVLGQADAVHEARQVYEASNIGFADCLVGRMNVRSGCAYTLTFDKKAGRPTGYQNVRDWEDQADVP